MSWNVIRTRICTAIRPGIPTFGKFFSLRRPLLQSRTFFVTSAMDSNQTNKVHHDGRKNCFYIQFNDGGKALLEYEKTQNNILDFYHTEVPINQQGKGIAKHLVKEAMGYAFGNAFKVKPSCSYVLKYVKENLEDSEMEKIII